MTEVIYKQIPGYENLYLISNTGIIINQLNGKELKQTLANHGYLHVSLIRNKTQKKYLVHRLLGDSFIENPDNKPCIDHIDREKTNNNLNNLRWVSHSENSQNRGKQSNNTSGIIGIYETSKSNGKYLYYKAQIMAEGKRYQKLFPRTDIGFIQASEYYFQMKKEHHIT